tara:strand:- start:296 stop:688 length:393 start_codon:yes stop_codon:yes gene_type:complete
MSTRAQIRFATRETGQSFNKHPDKIHAQFYCHSDGYPEGLGLDIAEMIYSCKHVGAWEIEHVQTQHGDLDFIYYIWSDYDKDTFLSIFEMMDYGDHEGECVFVGTPEKLITKYGSQLKESYYKLNTNDDG